MRVADDSDATVHDNGACVRSWRVGVSVAIESQGERAVITGDVIHHPAQIARLDWSVRFDSDAARARATRKALLGEWAEAPILVIGTHFPPPTAGRVRCDGATYRFECERAAQPDA